MLVSLCVSMQKMKEETTKMAGGKGSPSEFRIRDNLTNTLTRKFVETMKDYQNSQTKYKAFLKKKVERQVHIVKPEATSGACLYTRCLQEETLSQATQITNIHVPNQTTEEIDAVMRSGMGADQIITQAILKVGSFVRGRLGCRHALHRRRRRKGS